jgi:hydrogenase nickel incorporation protein HypA/HybF
MHETGLADGIVRAALRRGAGRRVTGLRVRVGGHPVDPLVVTQGIQIAAAGTLAEGVEVDLVLEPMTVHCAGCGHHGPVTDHLAVVACRHCGAVDVEVSGGDEVVLESITLAEASGQPADATTGGTRE